MYHTKEKDNKLKYLCTRHGHIYGYVCMVWMGHSICGSWSRRAKMTHKKWETNKMWCFEFSVADPDPGSGIGCFLTPGSGIRNRFFPDPGSGINFPNPQHCLNCSFLTTEGFFFSLGVLYRGIGMSILLFLAKKNKKLYGAITKNAGMGGQGWRN